MSTHFDVHLVKRTSIFILRLRGHAAGKAFFMLGKCFSVITILSFIYAAFTNNIGALSGAILDGAEKAVALSYSLLGVMCLWGGIMSLMTAAGMIRRLSRALRPALRLAFPYAFSSGVGADEITACVSANMLGIGNAATPLAISAMKKLQSGGDDAFDDMVTLAVLGASPPNIFPSTLIALRRAAGCADPYAVIIPIWIVSASCAVLAVTICRIVPRLFRRRV